MNLPTPLHPHARQFTLDLHNEIIVDSFAGGGGASTGIWLALARHVDHAKNHAWDALGMHRINHPQTVHHLQDVFDVDPATLDAPFNRRIGLAWFSPDCKHFSKAKGGQPLSKKIRGLVLVMLRYAKVRARVMIMENVEEIQTWGPLKRIKKNGVWGWYPDPAHKGRTWRAFLACLTTGIEPDHPDLPEFLDVLCGDEKEKGCTPLKKRQILAAKARLKPDLVRGYGYRFEGWELKACDYGAPTIRNRFYMVARCDGKPILKPQPTHADPKALPGRSSDGTHLKPWRPVHECIDWHLPCPSIFLTHEEARAQGLKIKRPLAPASLRRIAKGIDRYVLKAARPFLVSFTHQGGDNRVESVDAPAKVITGANRGEKGLVSPLVVNSANSKTTGRGPNAWSPEEPLRTQTSSPGFNLAAASLTKYHGSHSGRDDGSDRHPSLDAPLQTQDTSNRFGLTGAELAPFLTEHANASTQRVFGPEEPLRTQCGEVKGGHFAMVGASIIGAGGPAFSGKPVSVDRPFKAQTTENHSALSAATMIQTGYGERPGQAPRCLDIHKPLGTVVDGGKHAPITATLINTSNGKFDDAPSRSIDPEGQLPTATGEQKFAAITGTLVHVAHGEQDKEGNPRRGRGAHALTESMPTATATKDLALAACSTVKMRGTNIGHGMEEPMHTQSAGGTHHGLSACSIIRHFGQSIGQGVEEPGPTVMGAGQGKTGLLAAALAQHNGGYNTCDARDAHDPLSAITQTGSQQQVIAASLTAHYGSEADGQAVEEPLRTQSPTPELPLVTHVNGEPVN